MHNPAFSPNSRRFRDLCLLLAGSTLLLSGCFDAPPDGLQKSQPAETTVVLDFYHRPLPEIPLPNDLATRFDDSARTKRRLNASQVAPTSFERRTRELVDRLDGWGVYSPISVPFSAPLDLQAIVDGHHGDDFEFANDVVYVIDVTKGSPTYGEPAELDIGNGNFPLVLEKIDHYWHGDPRRDTNTMVFEEEDEDTNGNGKLDPGEDVDLDGKLDKPNWFDIPHGSFDPAKHKHKAKMTLAERAAAMMTFYERESNTLIMRPLVPLRAATTYAVVVTRRVKDKAGKAVGSPYEWVHHLGQTDALQPLTTILDGSNAKYGGLKMSDVAFAWTFTTTDVYAPMKAIRDGLYGFGPQKHLAEQFPARLSELNPLHNAKPTKKFENLYIVSGETFQTVAQLVAQGGLVSLGGKNQKARYMEGLKYVGHHVFGTFKSPRMFRRTDKDGNYLGYNQMSWPESLATDKAQADEEEITFWLTIPRKEATKDGKPAGIVILGHGYTGNKTENFGYHPHFARMGLAVVSFDNVSHGLDLGKKDSDTLNGGFDALGLGPLAKALTRNRSWDQDLDGVGDSGADFWTAYTFHTRDVVRQTAVDYMQLVRILRSWDGKRKWDFDVNDDGVKELAGDFDADGEVDVGGPNMPISMTGGSLGGIMSAVVGGAEPHIASIVPIAGGGGLIDIGIRSIQGGVKEAVTLRLMGPLYVGFPDPKKGELSIQTIMPRLNDTEQIEVNRLTKEQFAKLAAGDSVLAQNVDNGEYDCARIRVDDKCVGGCKGDKECEKACLTFRVALASDIDPKKPQRHVLAFYKGDAFEMGKIDPTKHRACELKAGVSGPLVQIDKFGADIKYHFRSAPLDFKKGEHLAPLAEGLGLHRARPSMRRFMGFAQMVLDPADPAVWAKNFHNGQMRYENGEVVSTHAIVLNTVGDMNVPVNSGAAIGRAAGLLDWKKRVDGWGKRTVNQVLVDTFVLEAVDKIPRFVDSSGTGVLFDPENLSKTKQHAPLPAMGNLVKFGSAAPRGNDGFEVPRLDPPLNAHAIGKDPVGGISGTFFPYVEPGGKHGFWEPGGHTDKLVKWCEEGKQPKIDAAKACDEQPWFDHGAMVIGASGRYMATSGKTWELLDCYSTASCGFVQAVPKARK